MRPLRIEIEGFTSFRERTVIDFEDADLFVLSGPMGAGKSSVIDAMGFALYGNIARLQGRAQVAPIVSQGLKQARVRLDFSLGGKEYTAVRLVRLSTAGAASIAEARLMQGEVLLAGDARELTAKVEELLGLNFEQYNRCVVLPQGEFSELLHAKPAERQDLLVKLLDVDLYGRIGTRATGRANAANAAAVQLQKEIDNTLADATNEKFDEQERRVRALKDLVEKLDADERTLADLTRAAEEYRAAATQLGDSIRILAAVRPPEGVGDLAARIDAAKVTEDAARQRSEVATAKVRELDETMKGLPDKTALQLTINAYQDRKSQQDDLAGAERQLLTARAALETGEKAVKDAAAALDAALAEQNRIEREDSAYHASKDLKAGDVCPVCGEVLNAAPALTPPQGAEAAEAAVMAARRQHQQAEEKARAAGPAVARLTASIDQYNARIRELDAQLKEQPPAPEVGKLLVAVKKAEQDLLNARRQEQVARQEHDNAGRALQELRSRESAGMGLFQQARDRVVAFGAPAPEGNIEQCWQALTAWAQAEAEARKAQMATAQQKLTEAETGRQQLQEGQLALCLAGGVEVRGASTRDAARAALVRAEERLHAIDESIGRRQTVERELDERSKAAATAKLLGTHLRADHFEAWYLQEVMQRLVNGATERMQDLSAGQYSLTLSDKGNDFFVIDHINANEQRPVRTLSGGETFLASLALALALGDDIASLAAKGASRLDALFLDEGFGSLDQNTLETVATTIEELGARGRMVGIITHVQELADRVPVQFRVNKINGTSRVERMQAG